MTSFGVSTGSGFPATARWARRRWVGMRPGRIPLTEPKKGKRSLLCEGRGVPLAIEIAGANRRDFQLLEPTLDRIVIERPDVTPTRRQAISLDKAYDYAPIYRLLAEHGLTPHILSRTQEHDQLEHDPDFHARRWVVERTHSWLNRFRGLLIRWSKNPENHRALLHLACGIITWRIAIGNDLPR